MDTTKPKARVLFSDLKWGKHFMLAGHERVAVNGFVLIRGPFTHGKVEIQDSTGKRLGRYTMPHEIEEIINGTLAD